MATFTDPARVLVSVAVRAHSPCRVDESVAGEESYLPFHGNIQGRQWAGGQQIHPSHVVLQHVHAGVSRVSHAAWLGARTDSTHCGCKRVIVGHTQMVSCLLVIYSGVQTPASLAFDDYRGYILAHCLVRPESARSLARMGRKTCVRQSIPHLRHSARTTHATSTLATSTHATSLALTRSALTPCSLHALLCSPCLALALARSLLRSGLGAIGRGPTQWTCS